MRLSLLLVAHFVKAGNAVFSCGALEVDDFLLLGSGDGLALLSFFVQGHNLPYLFHLERIGLVAFPVRVGEPHYALEGVCLDRADVSVFQMKRTVKPRKVFLGVQIDGGLIVDAAFEFAALPGQFLRIQGKVLASCRCGGDGLEVVDIP